ncbi:uncharacterized protein PG986_003264 [Apiospora aurea]|uniref:Uncharacterized protein n=1 Tax=Apiospora aurea TaxID=335848 RepID=A0ABR1QR57_9PEZI
MWETIGIGGINAYIHGLHASMLDSLYKEMMDELLHEAAERGFRGKPDPPYDKAEVADLKEVAPDVFPDLRWETWLDLSESLAADDIATVYNRVRSGKSGFGAELRARPPPLERTGLIEACFYRNEQILSTARTSSKAFPGPTESWKTGLRPDGSLFTYEMVGHIDTSVFKFLPWEDCATKGWIFLDGHIDTSSDSQVSSAQEVLAKFDDWVRQFNQRCTDFVEQLDGCYITKDALASIQRKYGVVKI